MISVIVTTYNSPAFLSMVLKSFSCQTDSDFELIVADDGSTDETRQVIEAASKSYDYPLKHAWQEDNGFRAAASRNNAVSLSSGEYLVFVDGDCLATPSFIASHRRLIESGYFVRGNRVLLKEAYTQQVVQHNDMPPGSQSWWQRWRNGDVNRISPLYPLPSLRYLKKTNPWGVLSCNLGLSRADFDKVNGFDENYVGWGREDTDLVIRLIKAGVYRKEARHDVPLVHLWHPENDRGSLPQNDKRLKDTMDGSRIEALHGMRERLQSGATDENQTS